MKIQNSIIASIICALIIGCGGGDKVPAYKAGAAGESTPVKLPPITEKVLPNGLKIIAVEKHELPVMSLKMMVKAGSSQDPLGKAGLAGMTAGLLTKGTISRSATDIAEEIDFIGANLNSNTDWDASYVSYSGLKKHFDKGLEVFSDVILNPVFQLSEIDRLRKQKISSYINSKDDPESLVNEHFNRLLYGNHPFGFNADGTDQSLPKINRQDIIDYYQNYFAPNNSVLVVSGDIVPEEMFGILEGKFGKWRQKYVNFPEISQPEVVKGYKILLVNRPEAVQTQIAMGHFGIDRANPDYFNISLMNYILGGGGFASRLMKKVRSEMGLTYGIDSNFSSRKMTGPFSITTFTKNESVAAAIKEIFNQVRLVEKENVKAEELADAKSYLSGSYPMRFETPNQIASQLLYVELYNLGADYIASYRDKVQAVTIEQVKTAADKYLDPDNMVIVAVGKKDEIIDQMKTFGEVEVMEIE